MFAVGQDLKYFKKEPDHQMFYLLVILAGVSFVAGLQIFMIFR